MLSKGILFLFTSSLCYSASCLAFVVSEANSAQVTTWVGILGLPITTALLSLEKSFKPKKLYRNKDLYLSIVSAFFFGGFGIWVNFHSLKYILPSDNNMVSIFIILVMSVTMQAIEDKIFPTILTLFSVLLGIIGTVFICNPKQILSSEILSSGTLKGVIFAALSGSSLTIMYSNVRRFHTISPTLSCLGMMIGNFTFGITSYRPFSGETSCAITSLIMSLIAAGAQSLTSYLGMHGSMLTTITALSIMQLLAPSLNFVAQYFLFPARVVWTSAIGIIFVVLAVLVQLKVLRDREKMLKIRTNENVIYETKH